MRKIRMFLLAAGVLGACLGLGLVAFAGQAAAGAGQRGGRPGMRRESVDERLARMSERLNLTQEQKEKIRPILQHQVDQWKALRADTSLSEEDRRAKAREIGKSTHEQIEQILTPEQKEKMKEMMQKARERREEHKPPATQ
jgi:periplasmic protein CpxP/Spy